MKFFLPKNETVGKMENVIDNLVNLAAIRSYALPSLLRKNEKSIGSF